VKSNRKNNKKVKNQSLGVRNVICLGEKSGEPTLLKKMASMRFPVIENEFSTIRKCKHTT